MPRRRSFSAKARFEIFKRDKFCCQYCGAHPPDAVLEIDHITAVANGGGNDPDNLITACWKCNRGKSSRKLTNVPRSLEEQAAEVAEREKQLRGYHDVMQSRRDRIEDESWRVARVLRASAEAGFRTEWLASIKMFLGKLSFHDVLEAMELADARFPYSESRAFKYFCGICWNKVREQTE